MAKKTKATGLQDAEEFCHARKSNSTEMAFCGGPYHNQMDSVEMLVGTKPVPPEDCVWKLLKMLTGAGDLMSTQIRNTFVPLMRGFAKACRDMVFSKGRQ